MSVDAHTEITDGTRSHWFLGHLEEFGDAPAVICDGDTCSYVELQNLIEGWRTYLDKVGVERGQVVALETAFSPQACAGLLALIERGAIVVPLTDLPPPQRADFHDIAQVEVVITLHKGDTARRRCERTLRQADHELYGQLRDDGSAGLVLFSSGSSGPPKASVLNFEKVLRRYGPPKRPRRTLSFMNLDHIGGINTLLHTVSQGGTVVTVPERTPDVVLATIEQHSVEVLPTTPTFLNMVLISRANERHDITSLALITYGTEPMPAHTLSSLHDALPDVRLKQTYGLSELGIVPTKSESDDTLWIKLGTDGFEHKILDGILWIRSEMAMLGYLNAPAPFDEDGYFNTQDAVEIDGEYLRILGRRSEIINVGGEKVYPSEIENALLELPLVAEVTVSGQPSPVTGEVVKATVTIDKGELKRTATRAVREGVEETLEAFKVPALVDITCEPQHSNRMKKTRP
jgi:acyl-CoA synthetase (AMP-forming)/AMP-acid ligase II